MFFYWIGYVSISKDVRVQTKGDTIHSTPSIETMVFKVYLQGKTYQRKILCGYKILFKSQSSAKVQTLMVMMMNEGSSNIHPNPNDDLDFLSDMDTT